MLRRSERPLICIRKDWNADSVASAVALFSMLRDMGKRPDVVCDGFASPKHLSFLPHLQDIRPEMAALRKFVISIDTAKSKVGELSYEVKDGRLHIYLTPKSGDITADQLKTRPTDYQHDVIVAVDAPDVRSLGAPAAVSADFFYRVPIIVLDHSPANELYGQVNLVDPKAAATSEVVFGLAKELGHPVKEELATALLTGIIAKTRSFKAGAFTPQTLTAAADLVSLGAKRDQIVASLYRTKTIPALKLWGRALARMKLDAALKLVSSILTRQDFALAGAGESDLADIIDELIASSPDAETIALFHEREDGSVCCTIRNDIRKNADRLAAPWNGEGGKSQSRCYLKGVSIADAERDVMAHVRAELSLQR